MMEKLTDSFNLLSKTSFLSNLNSLFTALISLVGLYGIYSYFIYPHLSPLKHLPGPPRDSWWLGNLKSLGTRHIDMYCGLTEKYGHVVRLPVAFGGEWLFLTDAAAVNSLLATDISRPELPTMGFTLFLGPGVLGCEEENHRRQRRTVVPAFGPAPVRAAYPVFLQCSYNLRDRFKQLLDDEVFDPSCFKNAAAGEAYQTKNKSIEGKEIVLNASFWGTRFALDAVGKSGFSIDINSIFNNKHKLLQASDLFTKGLTTMSASLIREITQLLFMMLMIWFPIFKRSPIPVFQMMLNGTKLMNEASVTFIAEKRAEIAEDGIGNLAKENDIMTVLFRANMLEGKDKLTDKELIAQLPTFLVSGSETTGSSIGWVLNSLSQNLTMQGKLRLELKEARNHVESEFGRSELTVDELEALPYLNAVICESVRLHPAIQAVMRTATKSYIIPISKPILSEKSGKYFDNISVHKGQNIVIPTSAMNRSKDIFGEDAHEFNPERWKRKNLGAGIGSSNHLMSFSAGKRRCPAYKFAMLELKVVVSVLIAEFEFFPREKGVKVELYNGPTSMTPSIVGESELGGRMPLRMRIAPRV